MLTYFPSAGAEPSDVTVTLITDLCKTGIQKTFTFIESCQSKVMERALGRQSEDLGS